jgi:hypothetical protein
MTIESLAGEGRDLDEAEMMTGKTARSRPEIAGKKGCGAGR